MGTETLLPGAAIPVHRHRDCDEVLFVHKGQGRAVVERQHVTVVPGVMIYVPRQAWHGVRNTGTGLLHFTWTAAPPGIEGFFREMSRLGDGATPTALQELAARYGIEFQPDGGTVSVTPAPHRRHRRHRGGRARGPARQTPAVPSPPPMTPPTVGPSAIRPPAAQMPQRPPQSQRPPERRQRHRPHRRSAPDAAAAVRPASQPSSQPSSSGAIEQGGAPSQGYRRHVKEVYMSGRWVQVTGEGPVIASGHQPGPQKRSRRGRRR